MNQSSSLSHSRIWAIAGPMILANLSTPLLGMVDTAVVGHLSSPIYLGAVAIGTMIFSFLFWGFGFLRMVTTGLTSQAQHTLAAEDIFKQSTLLACIIAVGLLLFQSPIALFAFHVIDASSEVIEQAKVYFDIRIWSAPATLFNYVLMGWLIGMESSRSALLMTLCINLFNILFDVILVNGMGMHADGVALASVAAEYLGSLLGLWLVIRHGMKLNTFSFAGELQKLYINRKALSLHLNFMIRTLCLILSFAFFTTQGARQGDLVLAANMVLLNFITFMAFILDGFANATEVLSGKAIGSHDQKLLKQTLIKTGMWSFLMAILFCAGYWLLGDQLIALLTSIDEVASTANGYLFWVTLAPMIGVWAYLFDGLFVGATLGRQMRNTMLMAVFVCYLPAWYLLQPWQNHGLWAALLIFLAARGLIQSLYLPVILKQSQ